MSNKDRTKKSGSRSAHGASVPPSARNREVELDVARAAGMELPTLEQLSAHDESAVAPEQAHARPDVKEVFAPLLKQPHAPQGDLAQDFKTALYVCAATKHYSFEEMVDKGSLSVLGYMLASVGFQGSTTGLTIADYEYTLQELIDEGALEYIGAGCGFVATGFKAVRHGYVSCVTNKSFVFTHSTTELRFNDESGQYPLYSKFVVIPGDDVQVVLNTFLGVAYVTAITKMRTMLTGEVSSNRQIFFREKGFSAFEVRVSKSGVTTKIGDLVVAEILARKSPNILIVRVREVVDDKGALNTFIIKAVLDHDLPNVWPDAVKRSVKSIPDKVLASERRGRVDLRELPLVTIDGEDAKDFDDAVYCEKQGDKFHLYVAIADVSYYVRSGSAIDAEAHERTTSVYFPYYVIPMLPEELSNGICSLNPKVDRLCMVCDMMIDQRGAIETYQFYPAVMNSHARLTYTEAHEMITTGKAIQEEHQECVPWVKTLHELYLVLKKARDQRGVFEIESTEVHFLFDDKFNVTGMEPDPRNEAHMLIEECMIAANVCAATFVKTMQYESLYRIHDRPNEQKLDKLRAILSRYGIDLGGGYKPSPQHFRQVIEELKKLDPAVQGVISLQMLRAMSKAQYSPDNIGHFGLALENYAHFTSPIRRYPDLQLHRVIKFILEKQEKRLWGKIGAQQYTHEALVALGTRCSEREIAAADAEFDVDNSLKCEFLKHFEDEVVDGTVSTLSDMGAFITLNDFYIDGLLSNIYFVKRDLEGQNFILPGVASPIYVGDQIKVRIKEVDSLNRFITLLPIQNLKKSDKLFDLNQRKEQLLNLTDRTIRPDNTVKNEFFERIADISQGKAPEEKDQITRDQRDFSLGAKLSLDTKPSSKHSTKLSTTPHDELKARVAEAAEAGVLSAEVDDDVLAQVALKAANAKLKAKAKAKTKATEVPLEADRAPEPSSELKVTVKRKGSKATSATLSAAQPSKAPAADDHLLVDTAARIDADIGADNKRTSVKKSKAAGAEKAAEPEAKSAAKSKRSNAKAKQDEVSLEAMVESTKPVKEVKVAKPQTASSEPEAPAATKPAQKPVAKKVTKAEPEAPVEAKPVAKKTATKKATKAETPAEPEAQVEAKPAAKKTAAKKATKAESPAEPEAPVEAKPAAKKTAAKKASQAETPAEPEAPVEAKPAAKKTVANKATKAETPVEAEAEALAKPVAKKSVSKKATKAETPAESEALTKPVAKKSVSKKATKAETPAEAEALAKPVAKKSVSKKATKAEAPAEAEAPVEVKPAAKKTVAKKATKVEAPAEAEAPVEVKPAAKKTAVKKATKAEPEAPAEAKTAAKKTATKKAAAAEAEVKPVKKAAVKKAAAKKNTASDA